MLLVAVVGDGYRVVLARRNVEARWVNVGKSLWFTSTSVVVFQRIGNLGIDLGFYCEPVVVGITQLHPLLVFSGPKRYSGVLSSMSKAGRSAFFSLSNNALRPPDQALLETYPSTGCSCKTCRSRIENAVLGLIGAHGK